MAKDKGNSLELYYDLTLFYRSGMFKSNKLSSTIYSAIVFLILFSGWMTCVGQVVVKAQEGNDMIVLAEGVHWVGVIAIVLIWMVRMYSGTEDIMSLTQILKAGFSSYSEGLDDEQIQLLKVGNDEVKRYSKVFYYLIYCGCFASMLRDPIFGGYIHEEGSQVTRLKFYNTWFPFRVNTWTRYAVVCTFQFFLGISVLYQSIATFTLITSCATHMVTQLKVLQLRISNAHIYARNNSKNEKAFEIELYNNLVECVHHHHSIIRFFDFLNSLLRFGFLSNYLNSGIVMCAAGYILTGPDTNSRSAMAFLFVVGTELFMFGSICYYGERIINESEEVKEAVYSSRWYEESNRVRVLYKMIMVRCRKPLMLTAYGLKPMSLSTFGDILQGSYSYFNMLFAARN